MRHITFKDSIDHKVAILIKSTSFDKASLQSHYVTPLQALGVAPEDIIAFDLDYVKNKASAALIKSCLNNLVKALNKLGIDTLYVADSAYFKKLTGAKADPSYGYVLPCTYPGAEHMEVVIGTNHHMLFYNPAVQPKLDMSLKTLADHIAGQHVELGQDIIHSEYYPEELNQIAKALDSLHQYPSLTCDIEAFSLKFHKAGIGTISFAWDEHNGLGFAVDYVPAPLWYQIQENSADIHGMQINNLEVKKLLFDFFMQYKGNLKYHNQGYDCKVLIFELFMNGYLDQAGMLEGLRVMCRDTDDTKLITYLATNSTAGNKLSLKEQAHEFAGNYAEDDIKDIRLIPLGNLLRYNLIDCLSTWFVYKKHKPTMVADQQQSVYDTIFIPSVKNILQMELTGMPIDMAQVLTTKRQLTRRKVVYEKIINQQPIVKVLSEKLRYAEWEKDFADRKSKAVHPENIKEKDYGTFLGSGFNPGSSLQLRVLLYDVLKYPVINKTKTKLPSTDAKSIRQMITNAKSPDHAVLLRCVLGRTEVGTMLSTFIEAFIENSILKEDGWWYLHGNFNLGGTVSGRLSSSGPNLQNLPNSSTYAKLIKKCFAAAPGFLFCGADFNSLETVTNTLITKDPNKLKVLIDGYDGHSYHAYAYWEDKFPSIQEALTQVKLSGKVFKITHDSGKVEYLSEFDTEYRRISNEPS